jgi:transcriptional regulator with XRE-family HTH domain
MQHHIGNYLKQLVVNQGFTIKKFAEIYDTKAAYMSEIFEKEDVSTKVIRQIGTALGIEFDLNSPLDHKLISLASEDSPEAYQVKTAGRPITINMSKKKDKTDFYEKEIEYLRGELKSKEAIIAMKDELITILKSQK